MKSREAFNELFWKYQRSWSLRELHGVTSSLSHDHPVAGSKTSIEADLHRENLPGNRKYHRDMGRTGEIDCAGSYMILDYRHSECFYHIH